MHARRLRTITPFAALLPMALTVIVAYLGTVLWTFRVSLTSSRTFTSDHFVGLAQSARLFGNERWVLSLHNLAVYGLLFIGACLVIGFLLAVFIDQNVTRAGSAAPPGCCSWTPCWRASRRSCRAGSASRSSCASGGHEVCFACLGRMTGRVVN